MHFETYTMPQEVVHAQMTKYPEWHTSLFWPHTSIVMMTKLNIVMFLSTFYDIFRLEVIRSAVLDVRMKSNKENKDAKKSQKRRIRKKVLCEDGAAIQ